MPRGIPNSGVRKPRTTPAPLPTPDPALAAGPVDGPVGVEPAAEAQVETTVDTSAADVIEHYEITDVDLGPVEPELSPQVREIQRLKDQIAQLSGRRDEVPVVEELNNPGDGSNIVIHFLEDGLSALGQIWYRGQELEFEVGSRAHKDTYDRSGKSWLDLRNDEFAQVDRFGKIMFRNGPWPGKTYADGTYEPMKEIGGSGSVPPPTEEEIAKAETARKKRAAPRLPQIA